MNTTFEVHISIRLSWWVKPMIAMVGFGLKAWAFSRSVRRSPPITVDLDGLIHWMAAKGTHVEYQKAA